MLKVIEGPTIKAGESLSDAINVGIGLLVRLNMPKEWTDAPITFQLSVDGEYFRDAFNLDGYAVTVQNVVPDSGVVLPEHVGNAVGWLRIRSGIESDPVAQDEDRVFGCVVVTDEAATPPPEGGMSDGVKHIDYVQRTTPYELQTTDDVILSDGIVLDNTRTHAVHFWCAGITFANSNSIARITIKDSGVILGFTDVAASDTPIVVWCAFSPQDLPSHVLTVEARKIGSAAANLKAGDGGPNVFPAFIEVLQY